MDSACRRSVNGNLGAPRRSARRVCRPTMPQTVHESSRMRTNDEPAPCKPCGASSGGCESLPKDDLVAGGSRARKPTSLVEMVASHGPCGRVQHPRFCGVCLLDMAPEPLPDALPLHRRVQENRAEPAFFRPPPHDVGAYQKEQKGSGFRFFSKLVETLCGGASIATQPPNQLAHAHWRAHV